MRDSSLFALLIAAFAVAGCRDSGPALIDWAPMHAAVPELMVLPARQDTAGGAYLRGRVAIVGNGFGGRTGSSHSLWTPLGLMTARDSLLLATTPEEVGTVARLDCRDENSTGYDEQDGTRAGLVTQQVCDLTLVDRSLPAVIHRHEFRGPEPPPSLSVDATESLAIRSSPVAMEDVMRYLEGLPRR